MFHSHDERTDVSVKMNIVQTFALLFSTALPPFIASRGLAYHGEYLWRRDGDDVN